MPRSTQLWAWAWPLLLAFVCFLGNSPKWTIPICAWLGIAFLLRFVRQVRWWQGLLYGSLVSFAAGAIANYRVMPFPLPIMFAIVLVGSVVSLLPYLLDKWLAARCPTLLATLVFPSACTLLDWWGASRSGGGTWGHIAYTQYSFAALMQLASITGLWGIGFLIYWFGSVANHVYERRQEARPFARIALAYGVVLLAVIAFGATRLAWGRPSDAPILRVAGVTLENLSLLEKLYLAETGNSLTLRPDADQTDSTLAKATAAVPAFVSEPEAPRFEPVHLEAQRLLQELLARAGEAADRGASVVAFSEGALLTAKPRENQLIDRARHFARQRGVFLYFTLASFRPGEIQPGVPFLENKILVINPAGEIVNTYFKNRPVPGEPSVPGDGQVPVLATEHGRLAHAICYDSDFPGLMGQLHKRQAQLVVLPSGDWRAISPYHSYMAVTRAIENGTAVLRPVSRGLSVATDPWGRVLARDDYFADDDHLLLADVPMATVTTLYARRGDWIVGVSVVLLLLSATTGLVGRWRQRALEAH